jgi:hypothetical protein
VVFVFLVTPLDTSVCVQEKWKEVGGLRREPSLV